MKRLILSESQQKALAILKLSNWEKPMSVREFAQNMWPDSLMHSRVKNTGYGACAGKGAWLCGGSYLGKLKKKGLVDNHTLYRNPYGYYITKKGLKALEPQLIITGRN